MKTMMPTNITTIIFDLGGIFLKNIFRALFIDLINEHGVELSTLRNAFGPNFQQWKLGKIEEKEFWQRFSRDAHLKGVSADHLMEKIREKVAADEEMLSYARDLKKRFKLIAASNNTKELGHDAIQRFKLDTLFDTIYLSCDMRLSKPDRQFFDYILKKEKLRAEECLFVDDKETITRAAQRLGFLVITFRNKGEFERDIQKLINK